MTVTRATLRRLADTVRVAGSPAQARLTEEQRAWLARVLAQDLKAANPNFNAKRWYAACEVQAPTT